MTKVATAEANSAQLTTRYGRIDIPYYLRGRTAVTHGVQVQVQEVPGNPHVWMASGGDLRGPSQILRKYVVVAEK